MLGCNKLRIVSRRPKKDTGPAATAASKYQNFCSQSQGPRSHLTPCHGKGRDKPEAGRPLGQNNITVSSAVHICLGLPGDSLEPPGPSLQSSRHQAVVPTWRGQHSPLQIPGHFLIVTQGEHMTISAWKHHFYVLSR